MTKSTPPTGCSYAGSSAYLRAPYARIRGHSLEATPTPSALDRAHPGVSGGSLGTA
jgi:hypothetical protein